MAKHSPQWYGALARALGHPGYLTLSEIRQAEKCSRGTRIIKSRVTRKEA